MSKKTLKTILKFAVSACLIYYLVAKAVADARQHPFDLAHGKPHQWAYFLGSWALLFGSLVLTIVRWHLLVRALDIPFRLRDAFRLGFLGYALNFVSLGSVGGDLFRAAFIAMEVDKRQRSEAIATVLIDRVIGLYVLFVMAAIAVWYNGLIHSTVPEIRAVTWLTLVSTAIGFVGIVMLLVPGFTTGAVSQWLANLPRVGGEIGKLIVAVRIYRQKIGALTWVTALTVAVHSMSTIGVYLLALGLVGNVPTLGEHFVIVPLAMVAGALPLPMMGLGAVEATLEVLYQHVPDEVHLGTGEVLLVAVAFRVVQILNALVGLVIWLFHRREVRELIEEAEREQAEDRSAGAARPTA